MGFMSPDMPADTASAEEAKRQERIKSGMGEIDKTFAGFNDPYYQTQARNYLQYAEPQVEDQYAKAAEQLKFGLARNFGTTQSSYAAQKQAELAKRYAEAQANVGTEAQNQAAGVRGDVEKQRSALVSQLQSTADPAAAANMALQASQTLNAPRSYQPLGDLFSDLTSSFKAGTDPYGVIGYGRGLATGSNPSPVKIIG